MNYRLNHFIIPINKVVLISSQFAMKSSKCTAGIPVKPYRCVYTSVTIVSSYNGKVFVYFYIEGALLYTIISIMLVASDHEWVSFSWGYIRCSDIDAKNNKIKTILYGNVIFKSDLTLEQKGLTKAWKLIYVAKFAPVRW